ncbi:hypothetical protein [Geodermatophilus sp. URMC 64]
MTAVVRRVLLALLSPVIRRAGRAFMAGPTRRHALDVAGRLVACGFAVTVAFWNAPEEARATVEAELRACIAELAGWPGRPQVAVKAPVLGFDPDAVARLAEAARAAGVGLVFDSHAPEDADRTLQLARAARDLGADAGVALPARWARSAADAAALDGLSARVVKGQWADSTPGGGAQGEESMRAAYADLVARLTAGGTPVGLAGHDAVLLGRVLDGGPSSAEVELLLGLPAAALLRLAAQRRAPVRFYVAYGTPGLAFKLSSALRRPRLAVTLARGVLLGAHNRRRRLREALSAAPAVSSPSS